MRISDWSSDVCSSDLVPVEEFRAECRAYAQHWVDTQREQLKRLGIGGDWDHPYLTMDYEAEATIVRELLKFAANDMLYRGRWRSEEHTSELQSLMRISYAVFCLKKKKTNKHKLYPTESQHHNNTF